MSGNRRLSISAVENALVKANRMHIVWRWPVSWSVLYGRFYCKWRSSANASSVIIRLPVCTKTNNLMTKQKWYTIRHTCTCMYCADINDLIYVHITARVSHPRMNFTCWWNLNHFFVGYLSTYNYGLILGINVKLSFSLFSGILKIEQLLIYSKSYIHTLTSTILPPRAWHAYHYAPYKPCIDIKIYGIIESVDYK